MNESKFFLKRLSIYSISSLLDRAGFLLLLPVLLYRFSPAEYGQLALGLVTASFLLNLCDPGFSVGFMRYYDDETSGSRREKWTAYFWGMMIVAVLLLVFFTLLRGPYQTVFFTTELANRLLPLIICYVFFNIICYVFQIRFRIAGQPRNYLLTGLAINLLRLGLVYIGILVLGMGITGTFFGLLIANAVVALVLVWQARRELVFTLSLRLLKLFFKFGAPLAVTGLAFCGLELLDRLLLAALTGNTALIGIYDFNYKIAALMLLLITPLKMLWPEFVYRKKAGTSQAVYRLFIMLLSLGWLLITLFAPYVFVLTAIQDYRAEPALFALLALGYFFFGLHPFYEVGFHIDKKTVNILLAALLALAVNAGLNCLLIPRYQLMGAAGATAIAYAVLLLALVFLRYRAGIVDIKHLEAWRGIRLWMTMIIAVGTLFLVVEFPPLADLLLRIALTLPFIIVLGYRYFTMPGEEEPPPPPAARPPLRLVR